MPVAVLATVLTAVVALAGLAAADSELEPVAVSAQLVDTKLHMQARFEVTTSEPGLAAGQSIEVPESAAITAASIIVGGKRQQLHLERAEVADTALEALTVRPGTNGNRASAFRVTSSHGSVNVDALLPTATTAILELSLELAPCFYRDTRYVAVPASWWKRVPAAHARIARDELVTACSPLSLDEQQRWLGFASRQLVAKPSGAARIGIIAGRLPLETQHIGHVEIDLARELGDVPRDLHTAIVVDYSRSLGASERDAQRALVAAYLEAAPRSSVQVIAYARTAQPLLARWMTARDAKLHIDRALHALPAHNGSNVDAALVEAGLWLSRVRGTRRVIVVSDDLLAQRLTSQPVAALQRLLPPDTLVHVAIPSGVGDGELARDDTAELAPLAAASEGIAVDATTDPKGGMNVTKLLRPTSFDGLSIGAPGWQTIDTGDGFRTCTDSLPEGHSCLWWGEGTLASGPVVIEGYLWNRKLTRVMSLDPARARDLARALSVMHVLADELHLQIERAALAVNSVWSLFATWGGSGGYQDVLGYGTIGIRSLSTHSGPHTFGHGIGIPGRWPPLELRSQLEPAVALCGVDPTRVEITVETTREEIVDVAVDVAPIDHVLADCICEAVWDTTLRIGKGPRHAITRVTFTQSPRH